MTITYPRALPAGIRMLEQPSFDLSNAVAVNRVGGSVQAMELSDALWMARFVTEPLSWRQRAAVQAWWATLRNGVQTFYGADPFRKWPAAYGNTALSLTRAGGGAFDGTAKLAAVGVGTVQISTLPAGYQFTDGDLVEVPRASGLISLHQVVEAVTANGSGVATVSIEPPALADSTINSTAVRLVGARCIMVPSPGSLSAPAGAGKRSASFEAVQTLR